MAQFKIVVEEFDEDPEIRIAPMGDIIEADNLAAAMEKLIYKWEHPLEDPRIRRIVDDAAAVRTCEAMPDADWNTQEEDTRRFLSLDDSTRTLVLKLLRDPTDADWQKLAHQPNGKELGWWVLGLPAYAYEDED